MKENYNTLSYLFLTNTECLEKKKNEIILLKVWFKTMQEKIKIFKESK